MVRYQGTGICGGIAIGRVSVLKKTEPTVRQIPAKDIDLQLQRLDKAKTLAAKELAAIRERARAEVGEKNAEIFEVHRMLLEDDMYLDAIRSLIQTQSVNAEYAVFKATEDLSLQFAAMESAEMQARAADLKDLSNHLIACLCDAQESTWDIGEEETILCTDDLTPSETLSLHKSHILGFVTAYGSPYSHTAILARSMCMPAVVCAGASFLRDLKYAEKIIVDGDAGVVFLDPDEATENSMREKQAADHIRQAALQALKGMETVTLDGAKIRLYANISGADDIDAVLQNDAEGIGLFRSEFLYLRNKAFPSEEEQFLAYRRVLEAMPGKQVIIRTLDIGADKQPDYFHLEPENNPAMGLRAIRVCLKNPALFQTQLRALYRASVYGRLGILFPMIASVSELEETLAACREAQTSLRKDGIPYDEKTPLGIMIETPAAAIISDRLAPLVDFFSIGTNDLTQFTLAMDRQNANLAPFLDTHHEAVLRLIETAAKNAHKAGAWIGICGELAADPSLTKTFLRMGIDELSVSPASLLPLREAVRKLRLG